MRSRLLRAVLALFLFAALISGVLGRLDQVVAVAGQESISPDATRATLHRVQVRAAEAYIAARALGRVVAVASSATVSAGAVVGGSVDIGRVLQPFDALLETFSDVMMVSLVSVTAQLIVLDMLDTYALTWLLPVGLGVLIIAVILDVPAHARLRRIASAIVLAGLLAKFALPLAVEGTEALSNRFLADRAAAAAAEVRAAEHDVANANARDRDWYDPRRLTDALGALSPSEFTNRVDRSVDALLTWMTAFILETILMPLAIGYAVVVFARAAVRRVVVVLP